MTPARILVVEDDRVVARDIQHQLTRIGHTVVGVTPSGEDAVRLALESHPDLVLMDVRLEGALDGVDAAQQIRDRCQVPVVFLTAFADDETLERARVTEPFGYLLKPFEDSELRTVIEMALYKHAAERKLRESERRYAVTLASIGDAVIATDDQTRVTFLNRVAEALTGWPRAEATGRPLAEVFRIINEETRQPVEDPAAEVLRLGIMVGLANHTVLLARDGREVPIDDCGAPIIDDRGSITGVVLVFRDTTQRRSAEEAEVLRRANARLELALRGSNIGIWENVMPDGDFQAGRIHCSNIMEQLDYPAPESSVDFATIVTPMHPEDRGRVEQAIQAYLAGQTEAFRLEYRVRHRDGSYRWFLSRGIAVRDAGGRPIRFAGTRVDITDLKRIEEALRANEQRFRTFVDHATDAFFLHDDQLVVVDVNRQACLSLGYTRDELVGMTPLDFDPDVTPARLEEFGRRLDAGEMLVFESHHRRKDGSVFPVEVRGRPFREGGRRLSVSLVRDITERKRLEAELWQANARLDLAIRGSNVGLWEVNMPDGDYANGVTSWINVWEQLDLEPPADRSPSLVSVDFVHPDDKERVLRTLYAYLGGETKEYEIEYRVRHRDGTYRWMLARGTAIRDQAGKPIRLVGSRVNITELKRVEEVLRESEAWFRFLANAMPQIVWTARPDGSPEYLNDRYVEYTGLSVAEGTGERWLSVIHPDDRESTITRWMADVASGNEHDTEWRLRAADGRYRWFKSRGLPVRDESGQILKWVGTITDIDDKKRAEEALREAKDSAEAANRAKDEFLANVSHEIRTPMNAILGMTELALDTPLAEDQRQYLKAVKSAADNLLGMINDLLDFSKIEAGKLELDPADFSLRAAVGDTLRALAVRAHKKGLELVYDVQPEVPDALVGDAGRLRQVLLNLVGNAIKFTDAGEVVLRVEVAGDPSPEGDVGLRLTVRDTGIGIPQHEQERIFGAFEQEDTSTTRKYGGTGLGLTIAARLVALMGGTITVESEPGRGSTFSLTARFGLQPRPAEPLAARPPVLLRGLRVLVVNDNPTNRHILEEWLRGWQMEPAAVGDGLAAMGALWDAASLGQPFPLVLLDARMPETDGLAVAGWIRERAALSAVRIILLTSGDRPGDPARSRELRIDAHLLKPVLQDELLETIYRVMGRAEGDASPTAGSPGGREPAPAAAPLHILVAEDNEFNAQLLEGLLSRRGHKVRLAPNGREALALAEEGGFDLLLLDVHMPELDGFQVVRAVRERERSSGGHLPVIALTARSRPEDRERCLAAGMDDFLAKPVGPAELVAAIDRVAAGRPASQASLAPSMEPAVVVDPTTLLAACDDDPVLLDKLIRVFRNNLPGSLARVQEAIARQDPAHLRESAHQLCGLLSTFSPTAAQAAARLEAMGAGGELGEAASGFEALAELVERLGALLEGLPIDELRRRSRRPQE